jgi:hypothetical protein
VSELELQRRVRDVIRHLLETYEVTSDERLVADLTAFAVGLAGAPYVVSPKAPCETLHPTDAEEALCEAVRATYRAEGLVAAVKVYRRLTVGRDLTVGLLEASDEVHRICGVVPSPAVEETVSEAVRFTHRQCGATAAALLYSRLAGRDGRYVSLSEARAAVQHICEVTP